MKFRMRNPFRRKTDPKLEEVYAARRRATENKIAAADHLIKLVDDLHLERRCGVVENYVGPERRLAS